MSEIKEYLYDNKIKLENFNYYGLDHSMIPKKFEGDLTYIGTFCIKDEYRPRAFYKNANPDRSKNHKDYMTLQKEQGQWYISGIDFKDLEQYRFQNGLQCPDCNDIIYSINRHDMRYCECKNCFTDGGREYMRRTSGGKSVIIDLIEGTYIENIWKIE